LGGVGGPLVGGLLVAAGLALNSIFFVLAAMALVGAALTLLVPVARRHRDLNPIRIEPSSTAPATAAGSAPTGTSGE
jgi:AAHS family benzoate transporter-like MFS transporter